MTNMDIPTSTSAAADLDRYGVEVLCANWTPAVAVLSAPVTRACELLTEAAATDIDDFLMRFYRSQRF